MKAKKILLRLFGGLLLLTACALAFFWFFWLAPFKHLYSGEWEHKHSNYGRWIEGQKSLHRIGITHDISGPLGDWGGKAWTAWIMQHIKPGQDISGCQAGHVVIALADMTNQQLGYEADIWLAWWTTNQNKTQLEWIRDGFASKGIALQQPLTTNNILTLLKLATLATNDATCTNIPSILQKSLRFNAYRWLRDSGFKAKELNLDTIAAEEKNQILPSLIGYAEWYGEHRDDPGKLPINGRDTDHSWPDAIFLEPRLRWTLYSIIAITALGGWFLLRQSNRMAHP
jgi:hypothetical protein